MKLDSFTTCFVRKTLEPYFRTFFLTFAFPTRIIG